MKEEKAIKENWKNSPLNKDGKIELVPTDWVWQYRGQDVSPKTDLMDGSEADLGELWEDICEKGLYEPFIMRIGIKNKKFRLESGNHRIKLFHEHHVPQVPLIVQIQDECGPHVKNVMTDATHNFGYVDDLVREKYEPYMRPSEVFKDLKVQSKKGCPKDIPFSIQFYELSDRHLSGFCLFYSLTP